VGRRGGDGGIDFTAEPQRGMVATQRKDSGQTRSREGAEGTQRKKIHRRVAETQSWFGSSDPEQAR
jgi:hypothetical protein